MNRRISERHHRYLMVRVWKSGEKEALLGHTSNISHTGLYVVTTRVFLSGTRVRLEVGDKPSFCAEGIVARSLRAPPQLQRIKPTGMGIRFLAIEELVSELLHLAAPQSSVDEAAADVAGPADELVTPELETTPAEVESASTLEPVTGPQIDSASGGLRFPLRYPNARALRIAITRDLSAGGLFVPTIKSAAMHAVVVVVVSVGPAAATGPEVELVARVVHRIDPSGPDDFPSHPNLMAGMGVQVLDVAAARANLEELARVSDSA